MLDALLLSVLRAVRRALAPLLSGALAPLVAPLLAPLAALLPATSMATSMAERAATPVRPRAALAAPSLVVVIVVDQFRGDYLDRFGPQLTGGLARLVREGTVFPRAVHDHAITETAPGHAAVLSGRFPRGTGIVGNLFGVGDAAYPLLPPDSTPGDGASPRRFRGTTLVDWMRAAEPRTRVLSVSRKDRGAILTVGRAGAAERVEAFWYAPSGRFTTSRWYAGSNGTLPDWLVRLDTRARAHALAGSAWTPLLDSASYPEPAAVPATGGWSRPFPHVLPEDEDGAAQLLLAVPAMDALTLDVALAGARARGLGTGAWPDLLVVSLSTTDAVGHQYGPDSRELHDQVLRLDRALGTFLDSLLVGRDPSRVVVALTSDHGITRMPETAGGGARRVDAEALVAPLREWLASRGVTSWGVFLDNGALYVDREGLRAARVKEDDLLRRAEALLRGTAGVARVDRVAALARADTVHDAVARRWLHTLPPDLPVPLVATLTEGSVWSGRVAAEHGSPHDADAVVPLILWGAPFRAGREERAVRVVDLAPTLARVLGVRPSEPLDGRVLDGALVGGRW